MAETRDMPLFRWGEELRRVRAARRSAWLKICTIAGSAALITALLATLIWSPRPRLVWNASVSAPLGLYIVEGAERVESGDMVIAWPPEPARRLGAVRHYVPGNVPLVKRVAAAEGDRVCAAGEWVYVNGRPSAQRRVRDPAGRPLPWWSGCVDLAGGNLLLLTPEVPLAFDGRYFGITARDLIVGRARLIWPR